ncbi:MAG: universal stress protein [Anaerolineae bacterium]|jgi:nucleotide-binding universal stress UspA family protein
MYQKILIALQGKGADEAVLAHVQALAAQTKAEVTLLWVITVADDGGAGLGRQFQLEPGASGWRHKNQAQAYLPQVARRLREAGLSVETALVIGARSEADEIVSYAAENGHDLIAMASDSRPWYKRWIGGSPVEGVQRKATLPTLFVSDGTRQAPVKRTAPEENTAMAVLGSASL